MASMHQITVPLFIKHLNGIAGCIKKAQALCASAAAANLPFRGCPVKTTVDR